MARTQNCCIWVPTGHVNPTISLSQLVLQGAHDDHPHGPSHRPSVTTLEWLGLAVGELPYLMHSARTVDDLNWRSNAPNARPVHIALIDALGQQLASSAALLNNAFLAHLEGRPELGDPDVMRGDVDFLSHALLEDHPPLSRRADLLLGGYVTALAAAIEASGPLSAAHVADASGDEGPDAQTYAVLVGDALTRGLATLLGHARLNARDREHVARLDAR
jgi:hypothetical protein